MAARLTGPAAADLVRTGPSHPHAPLWKSRSSVTPPPRSRAVAPFLLGGVVAMGTSVPPHRPPIARRSAPPDDPKSSQRLFLFCDLITTEGI
ncbi:hypothetical protein U9M48_031043 [Paspalum notatum var. saurae]|uniref:Uncharacterized protein n=1 Tax=Paspalum notatum var. saurae TaxID=547442 RepID=A0AAQ3X2X6_PASNO